MKYAKLLGMAAPLMCVFLTVGCPPPNLDVSTDSVSLSRTTPSVTVKVRNLGGGTLSWVAKSNDTGVKVAPAAYTGNSKVVTIAANNFIESYMAQVSFMNKDDVGDYALVTVSVINADEETIMLPGGIPLVMVRIYGGTFMMGRYPGDSDSWDYEDPQHVVAVPEFWMGKCEITKEQWTALMGTSPWSGEPYVLLDPKSPAVHISWSDAQAFITALNAYTGNVFRLPSEAEWEYACRAGTTTRFYWGDDPSCTAGNAYAWWQYNTEDVEERYAHETGVKLPNALGLHDMSGNVHEWCEDDWHYGYIGAPADGSAWADSPRGSNRVIRGGSYDSAGPFCRSAHRFYATSSATHDSLGFRLAK